MRWHGYIYGGKRKGPRTAVLTQDQQAHIHPAELSTSAQQDSYTHIAYRE